MVNYIEDNGVTIPTSKTESSESGLSELEKTLGDVAKSLNLKMERVNRQDDATAYKVFMEVTHQETTGVFKKKTTEHTYAYEIGTMFLGITPINGSATLKHECPVYLVSGTYVGRGTGSFFDVGCEQERFKDLKQLGARIHQKLGNDVMLDTVDTWNNGRLAQGFKTKIGQPTRTCEYCGLGTAEDASCQHCGAPSPKV